MTAETIYPFPPGAVLSPDQGGTGLNVDGIGAGYIPITNGIGGFRFVLLGVEPDAPTIGAATPGNASADVSFTPGASGGQPILSYTVVSTPGGITETGESSPITIDGLINGISYTFQVYATNLLGNSALSDPSNAVIPSTVPDAPTIGVATGGDESASVAFTPGSDEGSPITGYTATSTPDSHTGSGASSPVTVSGLDNGTSYTFTVHATNANGNSVESAASNAVTPSTVPDAPTIGMAVAGDESASVAFTPNGDGGSAITGFTATSTPDSITASGSSSPITVPGLTNETSYTFTVHATNANGNSAESAASNSVTPNTTTYALWAPATGVTLSNGDQTASYSNSTSNLSDIGKSSGKWYWEIETNAGDGGQLIGVADAASDRAKECGFSVGSYAYSASGLKFTNSSSAAYGIAYVSSRIGVYLDMDAGTVGFINETGDQGVAFTGLTGTIYASAGNNGTTQTIIANPAAWILTPPVGGYLPLAT